MQRDQEQGASKGRDKQTSSKGISSRSTTALENSAQLTQIRRTALFLGSLQCFTLQLHSRPAPIPPAPGEAMPQWTGKASGRLWMWAAGICGRASPGKIGFLIAGVCRGQGLSSCLLREGGREGERDWGGDRDPPAPLCSWIWVFSGKTRVGRTGPRWD